MPTPVILIVTPKVVNWSEQTEPQHNIIDVMSIIIKEYCVFADFYIYLESEKYPSFRFLSKELNVKKVL